MTLCRRPFYPLYEESVSGRSGLHREKGGGKGGVCELCYERWVGLNVLS